MQAVEREVARAERAELREPGSDRFFPDSAALARARSQVEAHLQAKPDDAAALVLLGRVGRFVLHRSRSAACSPEHGCVLDVHARRAVVLDSRNVRYREFLAVRLSTLGRYEEAAEAIRPIQGGKHILSLIFQDFAAVPVPDGAVPWPDGHAAFAAVGLDENAPRFAAQTGRSWVTLLSIDQVEAFYRRRWRAFRFFRVEGDSGQEGGMQYLRPDRGGKLQPASDSGFMAQLENARQFVGVLLAVGQSGPRFDRAGERYPAAVAEKDVFLEIMIITGRKGT